MIAVYRPRRFHCYGNRNLSGLDVKLYSIHAERDPGSGPEPAFHHMRDRMVAELTRQVEVIGPGYGIVHFGEAATWLLLRAWCEGGIVAGVLHADRGEGFRPVAEPIVECVWEAVVCAHERDAWVRSWSHDESRRSEEYLTDLLPDGPY